MQCMMDKQMNFYTMDHIDITTNVQKLLQEMGLQMEIEESSYFRDGMRVYILFPHIYERVEINITKRYLFDGYNGFINFHNIETLKQAILEIISYGEVEIVKSPPPGKTHVVLNRCYGGFRLSIRAQLEYIRRMGRPFDRFDEKNRSDPVLVTIVKELKTRASTGSSELVIEEIPADAQWSIEEYDGMEELRIKGQKQLTNKLDDILYDDSIWDDQRIEKLKKLIPPSPEKLYEWWKAVLYDPNGPVAQQGHYRFHARAQMM